jgi:hypothetical protein
MRACRTHLLRHDPLVSNAHREGVGGAGLGQVHPRHEQDPQQERGLGGQHLSGEGARIRDALVDLRSVRGRMFKTHVVATDWVGASTGGGASITSAGAR